MPVIFLFTFHSNVRSGSPARMPKGSTPQMFDHAIMHTLLVILDVTNLVMVSYDWAEYFNQLAI